MKTLFKGGNVVNVFTGKIIKENVLIEDNKIIGVGNYFDDEADKVIDVSGKYICPSFIDGHIHIESTMLLPTEFAKAAIPHGTCAVVADPHEIANVSGRMGILFMIEKSENLPMKVYYVMPSCVPATGFDESGAVLEAEDVRLFYGIDRVLGLAEVMNYVGVVNNDEGLLRKIEDAKVRGKVVNGHAPLLSGKELDKYITAGIRDDHECSNIDEAMERIEKGQTVMIRQGTAARNLEGLISLFDEPYSHRCILVTDDKHPADLIKNGHIDDIIRKSVELGKDPVVGIRMATIQAAEYFGLKNIGAIAPGYEASLLVLDNLEKVSVQAVYYKGKLVAENGKALPFDAQRIHTDVEKGIKNTFNLRKLTEEDFLLNETGIKKCNVIKTIKNQLLTDKEVMEVDFDKDNGIDLEKDILKLAVVERHLGTAHIGLGLINGIGLKEGAIATSISHDSHNLIILGTNERDMKVAGNRIWKLKGGMVVVRNGEVIAELPLPYGGLMSDEPADVVARLNEEVRDAVHKLGVKADIEPFMTTSFVSLSVIPHIKLTTKGLIDVDKQEIIPLVL